MINLSRSNPRRFASIVQRGFSLIELLVVIAIFIIITSVVLARQNKFSSDILLTDLAYQVAISIRQAQVYGLGVQSQLNNFDIGYGIHFEKPNTRNYSLFADNNKNGIFDGENGGLTLKAVQLAFAGKLLGSTISPLPPPGGGGASDDSLLNTFELQKGNRIYNVCGVKDDIKSCFNLDVHGKKTSTLSSLDIVYIRPNPEAVIHSDAISDEQHTYSQAIITVVSSIGDRYKCVKVDQTGQVSVYNPTDSNNPSICS